MEENQFRKVLVRLQNMCVRREYCEKEIYEKALKIVEGDEVVAARLVSSLIEDQFVSDLRYASAYAREKSSLSGWGAIKIRYMLSHKGICSQIIDEAFSEIDDVAADLRLERLLQNKYRQISDDPLCKVKLLKYACGRGYTYENVIDKVKKVMEI